MITWLPLSNRWSPFCCLNSWLRHLLAPKWSDKREETDIFYFNPTKIQIIFMKTDSINLMSQRHITWPMSHVIQVVSHNDNVTYFVWHRFFRMFEWSNNSNFELVVNSDGIIQRKIFIKFIKLSNLQIQKISHSKKPALDLLFIFWSTWKIIGFELSIINRLCRII